MPQIVRDDPARDAEERTSGDTLAGAPHVPPSPRFYERRAFHALTLVIYLALFAAVIALGYAVVHHLTRPEDLTLERDFQAVHNPALFAVMDAVSAIGYSPPVVIIVVAAVLTFWLLRLRLEAIVLALANVADAIGDLVKHLTDRARPSRTLVHVLTPLHTGSFPGGHVVHYTAFYGMLLVIIVVRFRPSFGRTLWILLFALLIVLVGPSRVYLGEHWPSDVIAGYVIGLLWLVPLTAAYGWLRAHPGRIPHTRWLVAGKPTSHPIS